MAEIDDILEEQRKRLIRREREARRELAKAYVDIERHLMPEVERLAVELAADPDPSVGKVYRSQRATALTRQVRQTMRAYALDHIGPTVQRSALDAANMGIDDARQLTLAGMGTAPDGVLISGVFTRLPVQAIDTIVGTTRTGPLANLLNSFGDVAAERARRDLIRGMALGHNPTKVARELKRSLSINLTRANVIARTETHRAHREASRAGYRQNRHVVEAYVWRAACDERTCGACWAMHGQEFDLDTPMGAHAACRCQMLPKTKTWAELGYPNVPETRYESPLGRDLFRDAPESTQRAVLGPSAYEAYINGDVDITDFVKVKHSPQWGTSYNRDSLRNAKLKHAS